MKWPTIIGYGLVPPAAGALALWSTGDVVWGLFVAVGTLGLVTIVDYLQDG